MKLDALEDLAKARKAKGLDNWKKLEHLKEKLQGKKASHITFTTSYPGQEGSKKHLGSSSGNLQFILGYVSPSFHVAPYHFQLVDPNISDEEAAKMPHPSNTRYWKESGLELEDEGDFDLGKPHPSAGGSKSRARASERKTDADRVQSGYGTYITVPGEGTVYSLTNGHVYKWAIVKESYFASTNPDISEKMEADEEADIGETEKSLDGRVPFNSDVYPLVTQNFPKPGSVVPVDDFYAFVKSDRIEFFDQELNSVYVQVFDRQYNYFDLKKGGDIHPSILLQFASTYLNVDKNELLQFVHIDETLEKSVREES